MHLKGNLDRIYPKPAVPGVNVCLHSLRVHHSLFLGGTSEKARLEISVLALLHFYCSHSLCNYVLGVTSRLPAWRCYPDRSAGQGIIGQTAYLVWELLDVLGDVMIL